MRSPFASPKRDNENNYFKQLKSCDLLILPLAETKLSVSTAFKEQADFIPSPIFVLTDTMGRPSEWPMKSQNRR
jgi:hypothetical protein